ncbi:MAG: hypothetical protein WCV69_03920 [Patescibacteria group bacterium]
MEIIDPSQDAERRQAAQRITPQVCRCGCHIEDEDGIPLTKHDGPCCETCICGLSIVIGGLDEHQRRCSVYQASQKKKG